MQKETLWNANYNWVMFTNFALFFSFYLVTPLLPLYLTETFHASHDTIGIVLFGYTLTALLVRPFSGYIVDSFPRKTVFVLCLLIYFLIFFGYVIAGSLLIFTIVRTLHGGPFGACTVANSTMAIDVLPSSRRNEGIGFFGVSNNLASAFAPSVGIVIYKYTNDFSIIFWISFIVAGLGLMGAFCVKPKQYPVCSGKNKLSLDRFFLVRGWVLALNILFFGFCWGILSNYLVIYGKEYLGITTGTGMYFLILSLGLILSRILGNRSLSQGHLVKNATSGILLSMSGYFIFIAWPSMIGYYASAILIGLGNGHLWPAFQNMIISVASNRERGTANSTIYASWDFGLGIGVLMGGVIAEYFGYGSMFWMMAAVHFIGMAIFFVLTKSRYVHNHSSSNL